MNRRSFALLVVAAALGAASAPALSAAPQTARGFEASQISVTAWDTLCETLRTQTIVPGTARAKVVSLLGQPAQELAPDVYSYDNCRPDQAVAYDCTTLIVTFAGDRVAGLEFVNRQGAAVLAAKIRNRQVPGRMRSVGLAIPNK